VGFWNDGNEVLWRLVPNFKKYSYCLFVSDGQNLEFYDAMKIPLKKLPSLTLRL
jgi:hypothetical protein